MDALECNNEDPDKYLAVDTPEKDHHISIQFFRGAVEVLKQMTNLSECDTVLQYIKGPGKLHGQYLSGL
jgi:hypothetical protein